MRSLPRELRRIAPGARAGFTLAEVLITLLIMAGIMMAITQVLQAARTSRDTIHNLRENQLAGPAIMDMIERDLRGMITYNRTRREHMLVENRVMLGLDGDSIDFVTTTDNLIGWRDGDRYLKSNVNEVGYRLRPRPDQDDFLEIYRREDLGVDDKPFEGGEFSFLHDRVKSFDVQVFAEDGPDAEPIESWGELGDTENFGVPARLEVTLILENAARVSRERWLPDSAQRRTVTYRRVIRPRESLRVKENEMIIAAIPEPADPDGPQAGPSGSGDGSGDDPFGDLPGDDTSTNSGNNSGRDLEDALEDSSKPK